ncbi:sensor domain-containing diguanylate cyclase [Psychromonas hadalis]|uniref:sensor domain-containing diguanylate cyclase n=1 Tax=Psychromonas hadalis TaxID=211669 RepID=UPI0003B5ADCF|nr:diguanylate cyclase [Psychromonas hadalis]
MLHTKRSYSFELFFASLGVLLFISLAYFIVDSQGSKAQAKEIQKEIKNSYRTVMNQNKKAAILLFELQFNHAPIIELLLQASQTQDDKTLSTIKDQLYQALHFKFQRSRQYFPKQQIYLVDGHPLLRLDSPYQRFDKELLYNVGLQKVISDRTSYYGLALQDGIYLYRFFFPIFDDRHTLIAVAEVGLPLVNVQRFLFSEHGATSQFMFSKRQLLDIRNKWKLYEEATLSDNYYVLKRERHYKKHNMYLSEQEFLRLKASFSREHKVALLKTEAFSLPNELKGQDGFVNFLPLNNLNGDVVGHLFTYTPKISATIKKNNRTILLLLIIALFLLLSYYLYRQNERSRASLTFHKNIIDALPFPVFCKDSSNRYQCANSAFFKHFLLAPDTLFSDGDKAFKNEPEVLQISATELADFGGSKSIKECVIDEVGTINIETSLYLVKKENKEVEGVLGFIIDETATVATELQLAEALALQKQLMNSLAVGIRIFGVDKQVKLVNHAFEEMSGFKEQKLIASSCEKLFTCMQCNPEVCPLKKTQDSSMSKQIETIKYSQQGEVRTLSLNFEPLYDNKGRLSGIIEISTDISQTKNLQDRTHELIVSDELTNLLNLRGLMSSGENYFRLALRTKKPFFALHFDIHGMRKLNYQFGEKAGDKLLKDFADILIETFRDTDLIARIGGDEFVVLLNDSDYKVVDSGHFVRLELNIQKYNLQPKNELKLLIDTGIVQFSPKTHNSLALLLEQCEKLVYEQQLKRNTR